MKKIGLSFVIFVLGLITVLGSCAAAPPRTNRIVGSLGISLAADTPPSQIASVGTDGTHAIFTKVNFTAGAQEDILIRCIPVKRASGRDSDFGLISLWDGNAQIGVDLWLIKSTAILTLPPNPLWRIPKGTTKTLTISALLNGIATPDTCGVRSGDNPRLGVNTAGIKAVGAISCRTITPKASAEIYGNAMVLRKSRPILAAASLPSTYLSAGEKTLYRWTVTADEKGDIGWKVITFEISGSITVGNDTFAIGITGDEKARRDNFRDGVYMGTPIGAVNLLMAAQSLKVYNVERAGGPVVGAFRIWNLSPKTVVQFVATQEQMVPAGKTKTYELNGGILYGGRAGDSIATRIPNGSAIPSFTWTDGVAWATDYLVPGIPTVISALCK